MFMKLNTINIYCHLPLVVTGNKLHQIIKNLKKNNASGSQNLHRDLMLKKENKNILIKYSITTHSLDSSPHSLKVN